MRRALRNFDGRSGGGGGIGRYPAALIKQLPEEDVGWEYESCALVGNAGRVLAEENGAAIDQHDVRLLRFPPAKPCSDGHMSQRA